MKKLILLAVAFIAITFTSCDELDKFTTFEMDFTSSITVPASAGINLPFDLFSQDITTNSESTFGSNNTNKELLQEVKLKEMTMTITSPSSQRFDFLKEIHIYISADGLSELEIASKTDIPDNIGTELELDVNENDIKEYIKKDKFKLRVKTTTDEFLNEDVQIEVFQKFFVNAEVLGV